MWKYNLKEKLHAWFENEREQESAFGELKINQAWRVMYIPICFLSLSLGNFQLYYSIGYWPNPYHRSPLDTLPFSFHKINRRTKSFKQFQKIKIKIFAKSFPKVWIWIIIVWSFMVFIKFFWLPIVRGSSYSCASALMSNSSSPSKFSSAILKFLVQIFIN